VKTVNPSSRNLLGVLVGNKNEFRHGVDTMTEVTFQEGQQAAGELGLAYFETSAVRILGGWHIFQSLRSYHITPN
jgi:hypothetical protein